MLSLEVCEFRLEEEAGMLYLQYINELYYLRMLLKESKITEPEFERILLRVANRYVKKIK